MTRYREKPLQRHVWPLPFALTVRLVDNVGEAETLLPVSVLNRLCSNNMPTCIAPCDVDLSRSIVALDNDSPVGLVAYKWAGERVRVAHELWVDRQARAGLEPIATAMLSAFEATARHAGCSRVFVVLSSTTPLRGILDNAGYRVSTIAGPERIWFEKPLFGDETPLECA